MRDIGGDLLIFLAASVLSILIMGLARWLSARSGGSIGDGPEELSLPDVLLVTAIAVLWGYGKTSIEARHLIADARVLQLVVGYAVATPLYAYLGALLLRTVRAGGFGQRMGIIYAMLFAGVDVANAVHFLDWRMIFRVQCSPGVPYGSWCAANEEYRTDAQSC